MGEQKQKKLIFTNIHLENELLFLGYSKYFSRSHTLLSIYFEGILALLFGAAGIVFSLLETKVIPDFNEFFVMIVAIFLSFILIIFTGLVMAMWWHTKIMREKIVERLKELNE